MLNINFFEFHLADDQSYFMTFEIYLQFNLKICFND